MNNKYNWEDIQGYYDLGHTWRDIHKKFGTSSATLFKAKNRGVFITMSRSDSTKLSHANKPRTHTEETKHKISKGRKQYLKDNPDKVPYLLNHYSKGDSYPEKYFIKCLENTSYVKKYRILNYELDFALIDKKIDIEIDGDQHFLDERVVKHDIKRNNKLISLGWTIYRIRWSDFQKLNYIDKKEIVDSILDKTFKNFPCCKILSGTPWN